MKVLLIEDDPHCAKDLELLFRAEKFTCESTASGIQGIFMAQRGAYDIIILDLMLPDIDGYQVLRQFRSSGVETPVVILTALAQIDDRIKALGFQSENFVSKPFSRTELLDRVRANLKRASKRRPQGIAPTATEASPAPPS